MPEGIEEGGSYTRPQIATIGRVAALANAREWGGLVEFANEIHIYVTLHKTRNEPQHMYRDRIEGDVLFWDSRAKHTQSSLQIRQLLAGDKPIRFFCRIDDREHFVHCGGLQHIVHSGSQPVAFQWRLLAHQNLNRIEAFVRLARWIPEGGASTSVRTPAQRQSRRELAFAEGWAIQVAMNRYERDTNAREACLEHHGHACWVCGFLFRTVYGVLGHGFAFVHHRHPVAQRAVAGSYVVNPKTELVPICGNCHAMVHRTPARDAIENPGVLSDTNWRRLLTLRAEVREESWDEV